MPSVMQQALLTAGASGPPPVMTSVSLLSADMNTLPGTPTFSVTLPTVLTGDVAVIGYRAAGGTDMTLTGPAGWTLVGINGAEGPGIVIVAKQYWKLLTAADSGAVVSATAAGVGTPSCRGDLLIFRPNNPASSVSVLGFNGDAQTGNPASQTINSGSGSAPSVVACGYMVKADQNATNCGGTLFTNADGVEEGGVSAGNFLTQWAYEIFDSAPTNRTWDAPDTGAVTLPGSFYIQFTP